MKRKIEAVIFDADGTLLDTRELIFRVYEHVHSFGTRETHKNAGADYIVDHLSEILSILLGAR